MSAPDNGGMTSSPLPTDTRAPLRLLDRARAALLLIGPADPAAAAARADRRQLRNQARAVRAHRLVVARFGASPAGRAGATLHPGGWGA